MAKGTLEIFSDDLKANITVLDSKVLRGQDGGHLSPLWPKFNCSILNFVYAAIYWNNLPYMSRPGRALWGRLGPAEGLLHRRIGPGGLCVIPMSLVDAHLL